MASGRSGPPHGDDFIVLAPGAEQPFEADLGAFYAVPSTGTAAVWYEAYHAIPGRRGVFLVKSNTAEIGTLATPPR